MTFAAVHTLTPAPYLCRQETQPWRGRSVQHNPTGDPMWVTQTLRMGSSMRAFPAWSAEHGYDPRPVGEDAHVPLEMTHTSRWR